MPNRHTDRDRWEHYLATILLATRPIQMIGGVILFIYAAASLFAYPLVGAVALVFSVLLFVLVISDQAAVYAERLGAWVMTIND